jgi:opacity protein-like surface antigen
MKAFLFAAAAGLGLYALASSASRVDPQPYMEFIHGALRAIEHKPGDPEPPRTWSEFMLWLSFSDPSGPRENLIARYGRASLGTGEQNSARTWALLIGRLAMDEGVSRGTISNIWTTTVGGSYPA